MGYRRVWKPGGWDNWDKGALRVGERAGHNNDVWMIRLSCACTYLS
jgi:hypothetical protein